MRSLRSALAVAAAAASFVVAACPPVRAAEASGKANLIRLQADSDQAILLAQAIKDWLVMDLGGQRVFRTVRYLIVQDWVREHGFDGLSERQRSVYRDPARYDTPLIQVISVTLPKSPDRAAEVILTWDVPLRLWDSLSRDVSGLASELGRAFAASQGRPIRLLLRFGDAEVLRMAATPDGQTATIFSYR